MQLFSVRFLLLFVWFSPAFSARGVVLDWDTVSWTPGSLSHSFNIDPASPGNDITVTVSGNTNRLIPTTVPPPTQTPAVLPNLQGGLPTAENNLLLHLNLADQTEGVTVSVDFSAQYTLGVRNVSFSIFDVDWASAQFQDQLRSIRALSTDGVTLIAPTITLSSGQSLSGSGLSQVVDGEFAAPNSGAGSEDGTVTISFGNNAIRSFTFVYGSGSNAPADPGNQIIGIHDISFTPVPEINPVWSAVLSCLVAGGLALRHQKNARK